MEEESGRNQGGGKDASWMNQGGGIMEEASSRSNHGGCTMVEDASWRAFTAGAA
jgi:hypothetical protein